MTDISYQEVHSEAASTISNGVKLLGEVVLPGSSQLLKGHIASGTAHLVVAGVGVALLAPVAPILGGLFALGVRLNSLSKSVRGENLWQAARPTPAAAKTALTDLTAQTEAVKAQGTIVALKAELVGVKESADKATALTELAKAEVGITKFQEDSAKGIAGTLPDLATVTALVKKAKSN
ncbi:MAG: hypothetical protein P4M00_12065 [Azospirillaceae bacterium]|nr:hypothetical protein [Azospirillaceae bacterium]